MDWKVLFSSFGMIMLAEMGDKTQFAILAASARTQSAFSVWVGVVLGFIAAGSIGVLAGKWIGTYFTPQMMKWVSGALFVGIGLWILVGKD